MMIVFNENSGTKKDGSKTSPWKSTCDVNGDLSSSTDGVVPLVQGMSAFRRKSSSLVNRPIQPLTHSSTGSSYVSIPASNNGISQTKNNNNNSFKRSYDRQTLPARRSVASLPQSSRNSIHLEIFDEKSVDDNLHQRRASAFLIPASSNMTLTFLKEFSNKQADQDTDVSSWSVQIQSLCTAVNRIVEGIESAHPDGFIHI
ncbi:unnamed protein product [Heterobilharzia americana]|nr:unnamed protein product [Heterobilharzia americana]